MRQYRNEQHGCDGCHRDVHHVVSDQNCCQQFVVFLRQIQDLLRLVVAVAGLRLEFDPVDGRKRRLCC